MRFAVLAVVLAACSPRAVTPGARTIGLPSPIAPQVGKADAQLDVGAIGQVWGPELKAGNGRVRHTLQPNVVVEADAGILHVSNEGTGGDRNAYTGRLGLMFTSDDQAAAVTLGAGGGTSRTAGNWGAADVGFVLSGKGEHVRPVLAAELGYAAPTGDRTFDVTTGDTTTTLQLPANFVGKVQLGLDIGGPTARLLLGVSMIRFWVTEPSVVGSRETDDEVFMTAGAGLRVALE